MRSSSLLFWLFGLCVSLALVGCDSVSDRREMPRNAELRVETLPAQQGLFTDGLGKTRSTPRYGCYLTSPNVDGLERDLHTGAVAAYALRRVALTFPDSLLAPGNGYRVLHVRLSSADLYAAAPRATPAIVRDARCVIPDTPGAEALVRRVLREFPQRAGAAWQGESADSTDHAPLTRLVPAFELMPNHKPLAGQPSILPIRSSVQASSECITYRLDHYECQYMCHTGDGTCGETTCRVSYSTYETVCTPAPTIYIYDGSGGGGGGSNTAGMCEAYWNLSIGVRMGKTGSDPDPNEDMYERDLNGLQCPPHPCASYQESRERAICLGLDPDGIGPVPEGYTYEGWGKVVKLARKLWAAADRGEDLTKLSSWKRMLGEEWDTIVGCVGDVSEALTQGNITSIVNCALDFAVGFKGDDLLKGLDRIGALQGFVSAVKGTPIFRYLAESSVGTSFFRQIAESVGSTDDFMSVARLTRTPDGNNLRIPGASADAVFTSLERGTGINRLPLYNGNTGVQTGWRIPVGGTSYNYYWVDTSSGNPAIQVFPNPDPANFREFKIRFDFR